MARVFEIAFKLGAQMAGNFSKTMLSASGALSQINSKIGEVNKQQGAIGSLVKLRNEVGFTSRNYRQAQIRVAELAREIRNSANPSKELTKEFEKAKREAGKLKDRLVEKRTALHNVNREMNTASTSTKQLIERQKQLSAASDRAAKAQGNLQKAIAGRDANVAKRGALRGQLFDAVALGSSVVAFTSGYREMQKAQGELATLAVSNNGLAIIAKKAQEMSNQVAGVTVPEFIRASYDIRSGIESISETAVGEFTKIASLTAAATKSTTSEMTNLFAKGYGIYRKQFENLGVSVISGWKKMSSEEKDIAFGEYFSAGISTAVQKFKTDGSQMSQSLSTLGASATSAGHSMSEQLAVLGTLQKTMSGSEAATRYRAFLQNAAKAGDNLGLSFLDANDQMRTVPEILKEIQGKYGETITAIEKQELQKAFGTAEAVAFIDLLIQDVDGLGAASKSMEIEMKKGAKATKEMAMAAQQGREFELLQQRISNATTAISAGIIPAILPAVELMGKMAQMVGSAAQKFPLLTKVIGTAVVGLVAFKVASIAGAYAFTFLRGAWLSGVVAIRTVQAGIAMARLAMISFSTAQVIAAAKMKIATAAQWLLNAAMAANPVGLVVVAIGALIAAGVALYKNWDKVTAFFSGSWQIIKKLFMNFHPLGWMMRGFKALTSWLSGFSLFETGKRILSTMASGIRAAAGAVVGAVRGALKRVRDFLPFSDAKVGPLSELTKSGAAVLTTMRDGMDKVRTDDMMEPFNRTFGDYQGASFQGATARLNRSAGGAGGSNRAQDNSIQVHLTQNITLGAGSGPEAREQAKVGASAGAQSLIDQLRNAMKEERRLSYA